MHKSEQIAFISHLWRKMKVSLFRRDTFIFLFFLIISAIFWLIISLNKTYETHISIPIKYENTPAEIELTANLPSVVVAKVKRGDDVSDGKADGSALNDQKNDRDELCVDVNAKGKDTEEQDGHADGGGDHSQQDLDDGPRHFLWRRRLKKIGFVVDLQAQKIPDHGHIKAPRRRRSHRSRA